MIRDPRTEADQMRGKTVDAFTEQVDIMPTVLDYLGGERWPLQVDGRTLRPWVRGETPEGWREEVFWEFDFRELLFPIPELTEQMRRTLLPLLGPVRTNDCALNVIRTRDAKYVRFPTMPTLLYDLDADPEENINHASDPARAGLALELAERLIDRRMRHDERTLANTLATEQQMHVLDDRLL
jgi:arylsulfatase A-like enzyme